MPRVLVIQDLPHCATAIVALLRASRFDAVHVATIHGAREIVGREQFDAVIIDPSFELTDQSSLPGIALYDELRGRFGTAQVLMVGSPTFLEDGMVDEMRRRGLPFIDERHFDPNAQLR